MSYLCSLGTVIKYCLVFQFLQSFLLSLEFCTILLRPCLLLYFCFVWTCRYDYKSSFSTTTNQTIFRFSFFCTQEKKKYLPLFRLWRHFKGIVLTSIQLEKYIVLNNIESHLLDHSTELTIKGKNSPLCWKTPIWIHDMCDGHHVWTCSGKYFGF